MLFVFGDERVDDSRYLPIYISWIRFLALNKTELRYLLSHVSEGGGGAGEGERGLNRILVHP